MPCLQVPTSSEAASSPEMVRTSTIHLQDTREIELSDWLSVWNTEQLQWKCDTTLVMDCTKVGLPPPTFVTPWVCRKYLIHLGLRIDQYPRKELRLRIPVQVIY
jgi:hypothetical protein